MCRFVVMYSLRTDGDGAGKNFTTFDDEESLERSLASLRAYDNLGRHRAVGSTPRDLPKALAEHKGIVAALKKRDPALAEARMRQHVLRSLVTNGVLPPPPRNDPA